MTKEVNKMQMITKLKIFRFLCQYSLAAMIGMAAFSLFGLIAALYFDLQIGPEFWIALLHIILYLIAFNILLTAEGKNRKKVLGKYYFVFSLLYFFVLVIIYGMKNISFSLPDSLIPILNAFFTLLLGLLFFLKTTGRISNDVFWKKVAYTSFFAGIVFQVVGYVFFLSAINTMDLIAVFTFWFPNHFLNYIVVQAFNNKFYSHFIEENPKYFLPTGRLVCWRAIVMYVGGGMVALYLFLASR
jgi:hypothetical protein